MNGKRKVGSQQFKQLIIFLPKAYFFHPTTVLITRKLEQTYFKGPQLGIAILCSEYPGNHRIITKKIPKPKPIKTAPPGFNRLPSGLILPKTGNDLCNLLIRDETDKHRIDSHILLQFGQRSNCLVLNRNFSL